jgi:hypothetical protein
MKSTRIPLLLLLMVTLLAAGGCSKHYVDVYIGPQCLPNTPAYDATTRVLWVFPDDYVVFSNMRDTDVIITFPLGMFEVDEVTIAGGQRVILKVINEGESEGDLSISGSGCPSGDPKIKVGEGP